MIKSTSGKQISKLIKQLVRYALVGGGINFMLYIGYLFINYLGLEHKKSMSLIYLIGVSIGFFGHRKLTFAHDGNSRQSMLRYAIAHLLGYAINFALLVGLVDYLRYPHELVQGVAIFVVAAFLFIVFKYWVFPKNKYVRN